MAMSLVHCRICGEEIEVMLAFWVPDRAAFGLSEDNFCVDGEYKNANGKITSGFYSCFDSAAGVILHNYLHKEKDSTVTDSIADLSWEFYKAASRNANNGQTPRDYHNLKHILHNSVASKDGPVVLREIWNAASQSDRDSGSLTYQPTDDEALAIFGLDNGGTVSGLLRFHNVEMGRKVLDSVTIVKVLYGQ